MCSPLRIAAQFLALQANLWRNPVVSVFSPVKKKAALAQFVGFWNSRPPPLRSHQSPKKIFLLFSNLSPAGTGLSPYTG
jgi:hypothetical protein